MQKRIQTRYSRDLALDAYRFLSLQQNRLLPTRLQDLWFPALLGAGVLGLHLEGYTGWAIVALISIALLYLLAALLVLTPYWIGRHHLRAAFAGRDAVEMTLELDDIGIRGRSPLGEFAMRWKECAALLPTGRFWVLRARDGESVVLPARDLDVESRDFIRARLS